MDLLEVMELFGLYSGLEDEAAAYAPLCRAAVRAVEAERRKDAAPDDARLTQLAAANAFYRYALSMDCAQNNAGIKAGDVTLSPTDGLAESAKELAELARQEAAPLLKDGGFSFCGVKV